MQARRITRIIWRISGYIPIEWESVYITAAGSAYFSVDRIPEIQYNGNVLVQLDIGIE